MKRTTKQSTERVQILIDAINEHLHTANPYRANYYPQFGGWALFALDGSQELDRDRAPLSFDTRKSHGEMIAYLEGVLSGLRVRLA